MRIFLLFACVLVAGCMTTTETLIDQADSTGVDNQFEKQFMRGGFFQFYTQSKIDSHSRRNRQAVIYIEGDGRAWLSRTRPSLNPTPRHPLSLLLATSDNIHEMIFYLARPCQFMMSGDDPHCQKKYWTSHRYAEEVVAAYDDLLRQLKQQYQLQQFHLVGFSGGAAIAALVAARRDDVVSLRTVAGNLDTVLFTQLHQVSPTTESLNPVDVAERLSTIPQIHFVGLNDKVSPRDLADSYLAAMPVSSCAVISLQDAKHAAGWLALWPQLLVQPMPCELVVEPAQ